MKKETILISACLLGEKCKYDGTSNEVNKLKNLAKYYNLVPICPEISGGLKIPRYKAERKDNLMINEKGKDCTDYFNDGAYWAYSVAIQCNIKLAVLKENSPSCGVHKVYDGTFSGKLIDGQGVTTIKLIQNNIKVINEKEALELLLKLENENI